ncbi:phosphoribosylformylglycinamidine cyclo-ligase [Limnothrix redekei]|uniref:Phosphoribosylformylglycinamidine cyclo-ligase n=1 Tax=Limnothrix redekei LRLZ20PSL1 TaxID=3112953 RepID=A0ABW7C7G2_9CYAN
MDYREAGVDIEAGRAFVDRIRDRVQRTFRPEVLGGLGGFGGCFALPTGYQEPVLVSGTDGVGTKLEIAQKTGQHNTVGIDLVAMCVNDVLTSGAEPLFFLDYIATGKLRPEAMADVVEGIAIGCEQAGCALLGGETAEMPGFYSEGKYDLAGFCVGIAERSRLLSGAQVQVGDVAIALPSSGLHSNGFSLVRKVVEQAGLTWGDRIEGLTGDRTLGELVLTPTQIYVQPILNLLKSDLSIHGMAHITGGGLPENLPRTLGPNQSVAVDRNSWQIPPLFQWLAQTGDVPTAAMFDTFNMGVGFVVLVPAAEAAAALTQFNQLGIVAWQLGEVVAGDGEVLGLL